MPALIGARRQALFGRVPIHDFRLGMPAGATYSRTGAATGLTLAGLLSSFAADQPQRTDRGLTLGAAGTNRCANTNINPANTTGVALVDLGTGATLTVVDDAAELALIGLTGNAFRLVAGTGVAFANFSGAAAVVNTNPHTMSAYIRGGAGGLLFSSGGATQTFTANASYRRVVKAAEAPTAIGRSMLIQANAGQTVYFVLNQLVEESGVPSSPIPVAGAAATRGLPAGTFLAPSGRTRARLTFANATTLEVTGLTPGAAWDYVTPILAAGRAAFGVSELQSLEYLP